MDVGWYMSRPDFADRTAYPTANDVLDALWLLQDLAGRAEACGSYAQAERFRQVAGLARVEYRHRTVEAYRALLPQLDMRDVPCEGHPERPSDQAPPPPGSARG